MQLDTAQPTSEVDVTYWRNRVSSLEILVCELLTKNQRMRFVLDGAMQPRLDTDTLLYRLDN
jgi:hypothetical protein